MKSKPKRYIGDGVYTLFDGYGIWLHANDLENPTDKIYLEPQVLVSLLEFSNDMHQVEKVDDTN